MKFKVGDRVRLRGEKLKWTSQLPQSFNGANGVIVRLPYEPPYEGEDRYHVSIMDVTADRPGESRWFVAEKDLEPLRVGLNRRKK